MNFQLNKIDNSNNFLSTYQLHKKFTRKPDVNQQKTSTKLQLQQFVYFIGEENITSSNNENITFTIDNTSDIEEDIEPYTQKDVIPLETDADNNIIHMKTEKDVLIYKFEKIKKIKDIGIWKSIDPTTLTKITIQNIINNYDT